jgi:hypothetical protein
MAVTYNIGTKSSKPVVSSSITTAALMVCVKAPV